MSIKNKVSELIEQQFNIKSHDNYLAYAIHKWAASEISNSIALCVIGSGDCKVKYQDVASSFDITKEEINQNDIESIKNKIKSEAERSDSKFSELISRMDQSLREQSEKSIVQILNSSAEEMLRSSCGQYNNPVHDSDSSEPQEISVLSATSEETTTEGLETTVNPDLLST
ncbi:hypothetical protein HET73_04550 [Wolbachia endosymbiont of Atemnus politus]|uniref:WBM0748 family T4SS-associated protein n=1 Tax=Wolbachia endosymbiont of Atemnus politus TaxID=2682840 RepID=UPI0015716BC4|nr:hypothetical protein [Wolbachia endosymbiont of Atemnus politus]NSM56695.1 hypothetical protein [Wolbachia endosymbiont of Atemnus politus]NSX83266.1 hypothetical protein [Wolbachia endosymbiont of Atemnus politus]